MKTMERPRRWRKLGEQLQHLRLHGDVERRDGFVRDQHLGPERQRAGKPDALALAAGEFVRKTVAGRRIEPDQREQLFRISERLGPRRAVHDRTLCDQFGRLAARIERAERILKHHLDMAGFAANILARHLRPVLAFEDDRAGVGIDQPDHDSGRAWIFPIRIRRRCRASRRAAVSAKRFSRPASRGRRGRETRRSGRSSRRCRCSG